MISANCSYIPTVNAYPNVDVLCSIHCKLLPQVTFGYSLFVNAFCLVLLVICVNYRKKKNNRTDLFLFKQVNEKVWKYRYIRYTKFKEHHFYYFLIHSLPFFPLQVMQTIPSFFKQGYLKQTVYLLLVFFSRESISFIAYANILLKCL